MRDFGIQQTIDKNSEAYYMHLNDLKNRLI